MDITFVKNYIRVDTDDDDEYIELLIDVARDYVKNAVGECDEENPRVKLLMINLIATLYEKRQYTINDKDEKVQYALKSMLTQLQIENLIESEENNV